MLNKYVIFLGRNYYVDRRGIANIYYLLILSTIKNLLTKCHIKDYYLN